MSLYPATIEGFHLPAKTPPKPSLTNQESLDLNEAISHLSKKVRENCHLIDEYIELGQLFRKKGEYQKSFLLLRNVLVREDLKRDQLSRAFAEAGYNYLFSKMKDFGEKYFQDSLKINKDSLYAMVGLYQSYRQKNELEKAVQILQSIVKIDPAQKTDLAVLLAEIALEKVQQRNPSSAKKFIDQAKGYDSNVPLVYLTLAQIQVQENKRKDAIQTLEDFIERWPNSTLFALKKIETLYYEMKQYGRYPYTLNKCIQRNPQNFYAHHAYGQYLIKIRRTDEAVQHFQKALELCPFSIQSLKEAVHLYTEKQNIPEALNIIERFLTTLPNQHSSSCPRCKESLSGFSKNCPICAESERFSPGIQGDTFMMRDF